MTAPARRLDPGVTGVLVQLLDIVLAALRGADIEIRVGDAVPGMQALDAVRVAVPGVRYEFLDLFRVTQVDFMDLLEIAVDDRPARHQQIFRRIVVGLVGDIAIGQHVMAGQAAAIEPALVELRDRQDVGDVDVVDEGLRVLQDLVHLVEVHHVQAADCRRPRPR